MIQWSKLKRTELLHSRPGLLSAGVTFFRGNDLQSVHTVLGRNLSGNHF